LDADSIEFGYLGLRLPCHEAENIDRNKGQAARGSLVHFPHRRLSDVASEPSRFDGILGVPAKYLSTQQHLGREYVSRRAQVRLEGESSLVNLRRNVASCIRISDRPE
jgi:hypothetical protein